jgi:hypothetical protein
MDEIGPRREERLRELARDFVPVFGNGADANLAATILVMALASPITEEDRPRYLAALERLPKGSAARRTQLQWWLPSFGLESPGTERDSGAAVRPANTARNFALSHFSEGSAKFQSWA